MNNATHKVTPATVVGGATDGFPIALNDRWRVVDDPIQWILQRRKRSAGVAPSGRQRSVWAGRSFPTSATLLKREIRRLCGEVDPDAIRRVALLPEKHPGFTAHHEKNMAQYHRENPRAGRGRTRTADLKAVRVSGEGEELKRAGGALSEAA